MGTYLIDTNVGIDLLEGRLPLVAATWVNNRLHSGEFTMSVVNKIELLGFNTQEPYATDLQRLVLTFLNQ